MVDAHKRTQQMVAKHACYLALMLLFYVLQTTPRLFSIGGVRPVWLVGIAVMISAVEGEFVGALYGALAGTVWEVAAGRNTGSFSILLLVLCFLCALLVMLYLRGTLLNLSLLSGGVLLVLCSFDFVFSYWLQGHSGISGVYLRSILPTVLYSAALTVVPYYAVRAIHKKFTPED